jgi:hypothetical protein
MTGMVLILVAACLVIAAEAAAIDHKNLDEGRPLRVEDAYPIAAREVSVEAGAGFTLQRRGPDRGVFPVEILYGAAPNLQIGLGTRLSTDPHGIDEQTTSGDLRVSALYNFNQETLEVPAFAAKLDVGLKAIVTKSVERLSLHLNGGYEFLNGTRHAKRDGRYLLILGASYPAGAPRYTRATLVADVFTEQSVRRGDANIVGTEVGFRYQLTPRMVWDAGVGTEFAGPRDRAPFFFTTGVSFGF